MNSTSSLYTLSLDFNPLLNLSSSDTQSDEESKKAENTTTTTHRLGTLLHRVLEPHICFLFLVPSDYLTHADFCIFGYLDCKQQASLRVKIAWQRSQAQTETCGTSVPHNYFYLYFCPLPAIHSSISSAVFHFQTGYRRICPLISVLFGLSGALTSTYRFMSAPGSAKSNTWLITFPAPYFIDSAHVLGFFEYAHILHVYLSTQHHLPVHGGIVLHILTCPCTKIHVCGRNVWLPLTVQ